MFLLHAYVLLATATACPDTGAAEPPPLTAPAAPGAALAVGPLRSRARALPLAAAEPADSLLPPVEYSDAYYQRLAVHRVAAYTMLPIFAGQYLAGRELMARGSDSPRWVVTTHDALATGVLALFTVNTVTGLWNLWDARHDPEGRKRRWLHAGLMLLSDAGFAATGLLANSAENSQSLRALHRDVALASIGTALVGYSVMLPIFGN